MNRNVALISGTDYDINGIQELGDIDSNGKARVVKFNKFGYVGIFIKDKNKIVRRHLSDCEDIRGMILGSSISNMTFKDNRWVVIHDGNELPSDEVWVIKLYNNGHEVYLSRSEQYGYSTEDITKAWFTFNGEQATNYANKQSIIMMRPYVAVKVSDEIKLQLYE